MISHLTFKFEPSTIATLKNTKGETMKHSTLFINSPLQYQSNPSNQYSNIIIQIPKIIS